MCPLDAWTAVDISGMGGLKRALVVLGGFVGVSILSIVLYVERKTAAA